MQLGRGGSVAFCWPAACAAGPARPFHPARPNAMKRSVLLCALLAVAVTASAQPAPPPAAPASPSDYARIEQTLHYYLDGGTNNDFETLRRAFHPSATMRFIGGDGYTDVNVLDYFGERMRPGPKQDRATRVVSIDVSGDAASARLEIEYPTFTFVDYMTLLEIDGEWLIVSKVFHRRPHAAGTTP